MSEFNLNGRPLEQWDHDNEAGCIRDTVVAGYITQYRAQCMNATCRRNFVLTVNTSTGDARMDYETGCGGEHACKQRILGPLSDFKEYPIN